MERMHLTLKNESRVCIDERPEIVDDKSRIADWEIVLGAGGYENTNGLLRQCFPKNIDFKKVDQIEVRRLNSRPRKNLDFKTPALLTDCFLLSCGQAYAREVAAHQAGMWVLGEWRAWQDSNLQPSGSKPDTLSS